MTKIQKDHVAELGRAQGLLEGIENLPQAKGCATNIRKARKIIRAVVLELSEHKKANKVVRSIMSAIRFIFTLLPIERLKDYFNFCTQQIYIYDLHLEGQLQLSHYQPWTTLSGNHTISH